MTSDTGTLTFGPPGEQWHYSRSTRTYDLTRGQGPSLKIRTTQGPNDTFISVSPELSALVVIDMQNFFLHSSCRDHPTGLAAVEQTLKVIEKCRETGIQIIWLNWGLTDADLQQMPAGVQRGFARALVEWDPSSSSSFSPSGDSPAPPAGLGADLGSGKGWCLVADTWNAAIYAPLQAAVRPEDVHCAKNRMSGLWSETQPLWKHLRGPAGKKTLFFAGVNTDQCVLGTLADAYNAGWDCVLVENCCGTLTEWGREVCLYNIGKNYGFVVDSTTFTAAE